MQKVTLYSDGACSGNPGPGGYGAIFIFPDKKIKVSKGYKNTTNNRMELLSIIEPLEALEQQHEIFAITDSKYIVNAINQGWLQSWIKKGWKTAGNKTVKNQDLWNRMIHLLNKHTFTFKWVKGHDEDEHNEQCDVLAVKARQSDNLHVDEGYDNV